MCLHNGWKRDTEDDSSRVTSSSVFDFNGDGAAEVVYNDECYFRVYDGTSGRVYLALPSLSRTSIENPVVADVDNDGNAEIVFVKNNETLQCSETNLDSLAERRRQRPARLPAERHRGLGRPDRHLGLGAPHLEPARYHVTNVTEGGAIPLHEPESWKPLNGRLYNTYRSQPRSYGVAPDLALTGDPDLVAGRGVRPALRHHRHHRRGAERGRSARRPGRHGRFFGTWADPKLDEALEDENGDPLSVELQVSLEPGASTIISVEYQRGRNGRKDLPVSVTRDHRRRRSGPRVP